MFSLNSFLYLSAVLLHLLHTSILLLNVLISSEKSSLPVLLSVTKHSNATLSPWCGESLLRGQAGGSGRPLTHSSFLYLQSRECPDPPARPLKMLSPHQEESLALLCGVTDRRTGSEDFSEEIRTFKSKIEG